jgi:hypothetical protein
VAPGSKHRACQSEPLVGHSTVLVPYVWYRTGTLLLYDYVRATVPVRLLGRVQLYSMYEYARSYSNSKCIAHTALSLHFGTTGTVIGLHTVRVALSLEQSSLYPPRQAPGRFSRESAAKLREKSQAKNG